MNFPCAINGCGEIAEVLDDQSGLPLCWDCSDEIVQMRLDNPRSLWDDAADGWQLGLLGGIFSSFRS